MATGSITRLERARGFGFIKPSSGDKDIFFHRSALQSLMFDDLQEGQSVHFDSERDSRDPSRFRAVNVRSSA